MSKPGYHQVNLGRIFNHMTGHAVDPSQSLAIDFRRAAVVQGTNGPELQATFIDPKTGKSIHLGAQDVERLQEWTHGAAAEARTDYVREQREYAREYGEYGRMRQAAYADGVLSADERAMLNEARADLAVSRQEAVDAYQDYQGFARQDNELRQARESMVEVGRDHNARIDIANALKPGGGLM